MYTERQQIAKPGRPMRVHEFLRERVCGWFAQRIHNPEEPYALIALVRVCGGSGGATSQFYPENNGMLE